MNTKIIAVVVAVVILLGAGGLFLYSQNQNPKSTSSTNPAPTTTESSDTASSLFDLLAGGKTQSCTFSYKAEDGSSSNGNFYLSGTKMRGDITTSTKDGKTTMVYMIRDGDTTYVWGPDMPTGVKMTVSVDDLKTDTNANQYFNTTQKMDYKCGSWVMDSSKFSVPSNVKFTDVSAMMPKTTGSQTQGGSNPCAQITDPSAKAACESAIKQ